VKPSHGHRAKVGEPPRNRTENPQIKSRARVAAHHNVSIVNHLQSTGSISAHRRSRRCRTSQSRQPSIRSFPTPTKHGIYLRSWSHRTVRTYRQALAALGSVLDGNPPSKVLLEAFVIAMRQRGLQPGGINVYARTINSYLTWLREEGHASERLRIKLLRNPPKPYNTFTDADIRRLLMRMPSRWRDLRTWTLAVLLLDTVLRITEALSLERDQVDLDAMALRVLGKGNKIRLVPISLEGRKALFRWMCRSKVRYVFGTTRGHLWSPRNAHRDLTTFCRAIGITAAQVNPHAFRHCFAVSYIRNGGDIYRLSRILGHTSIATTQLYLRSMGLEHLQEGHAKFSPLGRLG
jgi:site-specific recombinase XerD